MPKLAKLWYHENCRVFQDRLINDEDRDWFKDQMKERMKEDYNLEYDKVVLVEPVIYGDFMVPNADPRLYIEIDDFPAVIYYFILSVINYENHKFTVIHIDSS